MQRSACVGIGYTGSHIECAFGYGFFHLHHVVSEKTVSARLFQCLIHGRTAQRHAHVGFVVEALETLLSPECHEASPRTPCLTTCPPWQLHGLWFLSFR